MEAVDNLSFSWFIIFWHLSSTISNPSMHEIHFVSEVQVKQFSIIPQFTYLLLSSSL